MHRETDTKTLCLHGEGPTAATALQALLAHFPGTADTGHGDDHTAIVRASASTLEHLLPRFIEAMQAAQDDFDLAMTAATLDGLMATDDGWRAWGTVSGQLTATATSRRRWTPGAATVEQTPGAVTLRLTLTEVGDG